MCKVSDCGRPTVARGFCNMHYVRSRKGLNLSTPSRTDRFANFLLKAKPEHGLFGCWIWTGRVDKCGYGEFARGRAHSWAWVQINGPVPDGLELDHLCRNTLCCNPLHLEPVTHAENMRRASRASQTHCIHGHPFNEQNTYWWKGQRGCRACNLRHVGRYQRRKAQQQRPTGSVHV